MNETSQWLVVFAVALAILLLLGRSVLAEATHENRKAKAEIADALRHGERFIDLAVLLHVVKQDLNGSYLIPGAPKMSIVRSHRRGGHYDTLTRRFVGKCPDSRRLVLYCSEEQEPGILHDEAGPEAVWMQGGMGSGKSTAGCVWLTLQVIKHAEHPIQGAGVTSPVGRRMEAIRKILVGPKNENGERKGGIWPTSWYSWREGDQVAYVRTGLSIDFVSAHVSSEAEGSPIQGQNWAFTLNDELQDYFAVDGDIQMRGRAAWKGRYERFVTVTPKRSAAYRVFRDKTASNENWLKVKVAGPRSPFLTADYWEKRRGQMALSEYLRKAMGEDPPPDNVVYTEWSHDESLRPLPIAQIPRWTDVTRRELAQYGDFEMLAGFDPGRIWNVTVLLKAFQPPPQATRANPRPAMPDPVWFVVGELSTKRKSTEHHARQLVQMLRDKWGMAPGSLLVRGDPTTRTGSDENHPDKHVYEVFRACGVPIRQALYKVGTSQGQAIPKNARIDLVNMLLRDDYGVRRLFVERENGHDPVAPKLVESFEMQELDHEGRAETGEKDESDLTHWPCALGYALWSIESGRIRGRRAA